jgi:hypothetical protein
MEHYAASGTTSSSVTSNSASRSSHFPGSETRAAVVSLVFVVVSTEDGRHDAGNTQIHAATQMASTLLRRL